MTTLTDLYKSRCYEKNGKLIPHFWQPQPVEKAPLTLFGDDDLEVKPEWGVEPVIERILALNYHLELDVGEYVREASKDDLPDDPMVKPLLKANVADEAKHELGIKEAIKTYPVSQEYLDEAKRIATRWSEDTQHYHPIVAPFSLEVGVFLNVLGMLRLAGGKELANIGARIAEDEARHTQVNRTVLAHQGYKPYNPPEKVRHLVWDTLDWVFSGVDIPEDEVGERVNLDFMKWASDSLIETGEAMEFDDMVYCSDHLLPFEASNSKQYSRTVDK